MVLSGDKVRDVFGLRRHSDLALEWRDLLGFILGQIKLGGGHGVRLGGVERSGRGYPHIIFARGGIACALWVLVGRELTPEERGMGQQMSGNWYCGVVSNRDDFMRYLTKLKRIRRHLLNGVDE